MSPSAKIASARARATCRLQNEFMISSIPDIHVGWGANPNMPTHACIAMLGFAPQPTSRNRFTGFSSAMNCSLPYVSQGRELSSAFSTTITKLVRQPQVILPPCILQLIQPRRGIATQILTRRSVIHIDDRRGHHEMLGELVI